MKVLYIILLIAGVIMIFDGIYELINQTNGKVLGFQLNHPGIGLYHIIVGGFFLVLYWRHKKGLSN